MNLPGTETHHYSWAGSDRSFRILRILTRILIEWPFPGFRALSRLRQMPSCPIIEPCSGPGEE
jgi:hypothetical protein